MGTLLTAYLATRFPSRPLYIIAVGLVTASLAGAAMAPSFQLLLVARIVQASGNALVASLTMLTIMSIFPEGEKGTAMGWFGMSQGAAVVVGPVLGGVLVDAYGWRALFWVVALLCAVSFVLALFSMRSVLPIKKSHFDVLSFVLAAVAFGGVTYSVGALAGSAPKLVFDCVLLLVAVLAGVLFVRRQLGLQQPFLDVKLLADKAFGSAVLLSMILYAILMGASTVNPLYVQLTLGDSATAAGAVMTPGALLMALAAPMVGRFYDKHGIRILLIIGGALFLSSNLAMLIPGLASSLWVVALLQTLRCGGIVMVQMPLVTWGLSSLEKSDLAHGQALLTSLRNITGSLGTAVFASLMASVGTASSAGMMAAFGGMSVLAVAFFLFSLLRLRSRSSV